jgi:hypothetical protein
MNKSDIETRRGAAGSRTSRNLAGCIYIVRHLRYMVLIRGLL